MRHLHSHPTVRTVAGLFAPSILLLAPLVFYQHFGGLPHFFLHTLMGWDVGLLILSVLALGGARRRAWEGVVPVLLAFWAMTPDFIYAAGPYHRDWMDVFLFHVSVDEILPRAVTVETAVWLVLLSGYLIERAISARTASSDTADDREERQTPPA